LGRWLGGFTYSDFWAVFFPAVSAGAIFQVVWTIARAMMSSVEGSLLNFRNALGFVVGMLVMYCTALLVTA
jgi:hypothetical protein